MSAALCPDARAFSLVDILGRLALIHQVNIARISYHLVARMRDTSTARMSWTYVCLTTNYCCGMVIIDSSAILVT